MLAKSVDFIIIAYIFATKDGMMDLLNIINDDSVEGAISNDCPETFFEDCDSGIIDDISLGENLDLTHSVGHELFKESIYHQSFGAKEDMLPYEDIFDDDSLLNLYQDPFGVYAIHHNSTHGLIIEDSIQKPVFDGVISNEDLQSVGNQIFDALKLKHIPIFISEMTPNASYHPGYFPHFSFDDCIKINPNYANSCINSIGTSDIVFADLAHEIGHYTSHMVNTPQDTYFAEKTADFISGFICNKLNLDIDSTRKWFLEYYDPKGIGGYPVSEERWDIEAAGYHFAQHATWDDLMDALKDDHFRDIIRNYNSSTSAVLAESERLNIMQSENPQSIHVLQSFGLSPEIARKRLAQLAYLLKRTTKI